MSNVVKVDGYQFTVLARAENMILMDLPHAFLEDDHSSSYPGSDRATCDVMIFDGIVPRKVSKLGEEFFARHKARICTELSTAHLPRISYGMGASYWDAPTRWVDFEDSEDILLFKLAVD